MLTIYADTFMTATRTRCTLVEDVPSVPDHKRHRWFRRRTTRCIDLSKL